MDHIRQDRHALDVGSDFHVLSKLKKKKEKKSTDLFKICLFY